MQKSEKPFSVTVRKKIDIDRLVFEFFSERPLFASLIEFAEPEFPNSEPATFFRTPNPRGEGSAGFDILCLT